MTETKDGGPAEDVKTEGLDDEELSTIAAIACNYQSGRITKYEITELIRGYRERSALLRCEEALRDAEARFNRLADFLASATLATQKAEMVIKARHCAQEARAALTLLDEARHGK